MSNACLHALISTSETCWTILPAIFIIVIKSLQISQQFSWRTCKHIPATIFFFFEKIWWTFLLYVQSSKTKKMNFQTFLHFESIPIFRGPESGSFRVFDCFNWDRVKMFITAYKKLKVSVKGVISWCPGYLY